MSSIKQVFVKYKVESFVIERVKQICFLLAQHATESCPISKNLGDVTELLTVSCIRVNDNGLFHFLFSFPFYFLILDLGLGVSDITRDCHKLSHNMTLCHILITCHGHNVYLALMQIDRLRKLMAKTASCYLT